MNKMNTKILLKIHIFLILALSCSETTDDQIEPVVYSDSIDFYDENNMSDDFVFVVENSSTNSYLINKQGFKLWEWNFDIVFFESIMDREAYIALNWNSLETVF